MLFGLLVSAAAFAFAAYLVVFKIFFGGVITGYASLMTGLLLLGGLQLVGTGVVGIYVSKVFQEVKARPTYVVATLRGIDDPSLPSDTLPGRETR